MNNRSFACRLPWPILGESDWPVLGENRWSIFSESHWSIFTRKMTPNDFANKIYAEHILDWFHFTMRITALGQMSKAFAELKSSKI